MLRVGLDRSGFLKDHLGSEELHPGTALWYGGHWTVSPELSPEPLIRALRWLRAFAGHGLSFSEGMTVETLPTVDTQPEGLGADLPCPGAEALWLWSGGLWFSEGKESWWDLGRLW